MIRCLFLCGNDWNVFSFLSLISSQAHKSGKLQPVTEELRQHHVQIKTRVGPIRHSFLPERSTVSFAPSLTNSQSFSILPLKVAERQPEPAQPSRTGDGVSVTIPVPQQPKTTAAAAATRHHENEPAMVLVPTTKQSFPPLTKAMVVALLSLIFGYYVGRKKLL